MNDHAELVFIGPDVFNSSYFIGVFHCVLCAVVVNYAGAY